MQCPSFRLHRSERVNTLGCGHSITQGQSDAMLEPSNAPIAYVDPTRSCRAQPWRWPLPSVYNDEIGTRLASVLLLTHVKAEIPTPA